MPRLNYLEKRKLIETRARTRLVNSGSGVIAPSTNTYATFDPSHIASGLTLSSGNLVITDTSGANNYLSGLGTVGKSAGKWYWEITVTLMTPFCFIGVAKIGQTLTNFIGDTSGNGWSYSAIDGHGYNNGNAAYGPTWAQGDIIGVALDMDGNTLTFYKNGASQGTVQSAGLPAMSGTVYPAITLYRDTNKLTANFGASAFTYSVPSGYNAGIY